MAWPALPDRVGSDRTPNSQHPTPNVQPRWKLEVGCWLLDVQSLSQNLLLTRFAIRTSEKYCRHSDFRELTYRTMVERNTLPRGMGWQVREKSWPLPGSRAVRYDFGSGGDSKSVPGRNRTCNLLIRSQVLYPIELQVRRRGKSIARGVRERKGDGG